MSSIPLGYVGPISVRFNAATGIDWTAVTAVLNVVATHQHTGVRQLLGPFSWSPVSPTLTRAIVALDGTEFGGRYGGLVGPWLCVPTLTVDGVPTTMRSWTVQLEAP